MITKDMQTTLTYLYEKLDTESKVYYSRFGDGDFQIIKGEREMMHKYSPELAHELRESFGIVDDNYIRGTMYNEPTYNGSQLINQSSENFKHILEIIKDIFLDFLTKFIRPKRKLFIGSIKKSSIEKLVGVVDHFVEIPAKDAYYSMDQWWENVLDCVDKVELVLPAAGMAGRVIQKRLWNLNKNIHSIELGSMVDVLDDLHTRSWMSNKKQIIDRILL